MWNTLLSPQPARVYALLLSREGSSSRRLIRLLVRFNVYCLYVQNGDLILHEIRGTFKENCRCVQGHNNDAADSTVGYVEDGKKPKAPVLIWQTVCWQSYVTHMIHTQYNFSANDALLRHYVKLVKRYSTSAKSVCSLTIC